MENEKLTRNLDRMFKYRTISEKMARWQAGSALLRVILPLCANHHINFIITLLLKKIGSFTRFFEGKDSKKIAGNFISLVAIQGTNFLLPLIVLPYLIGVLGMARVGIVSLAQAFVMYWIMFTDYGFNLSTTRDISIHKADKSKLSEIVSNTIITKSILCIAALIGYISFVLIVPMFAAHAILYFLTFFMLVGQALLPVWFFQGVEQMKFLTYANLISKVVAAMLIFILIKAPADYVYVGLFYGLGNIISGIMGLWLMFSRFGIRFHIPAAYSLKVELKKGWYIFLSHFSINLYSNSNIFILGFFASDVLVGYYSVAEKVYSIARQLLVVFFQATYPQACKLITVGHDALLKFFRNFFMPFLLGVIVLCLGIFIFADYVTIFFAKSRVEQISQAIRMLIFVPVIVCINIPAFQTLLAYNHQKSYMLVYIIGSVLNITLNLILAKYFLVNGTILSIVCTEVFITIGLYLILYLRHPQEMIPLFKYRNRKAA